MTDIKSSSKIRAKQIPADALIRLKDRLNLLAVRSSERPRIIEESAKFYGVSIDKIYRSLKELNHPSLNYRADRGQTRTVSIEEMKLYCQVIAAVKLRSLNRKGRHISTARALQILEDFGVKTLDGFVKIPKGILNKSTVNRYLKKWGYNHSTLIRESPAARFQAEFSNDIWHFDLSPSDIKHLEQPPEWVEPGSKKPILMIYSVADDDSGVCYQEYHNVYGEDTEAALRFLFNAMSVKSNESSPFYGRPKTIQMDNGPISKNRIFLRVMALLEIQVVTHLPRGADERKTTARSKGKVERPFRTVKEAHETLYHFHKPETEVEANRWLHNYLLNYNIQSHREEPHSRIEHWLKNHPPTGIREMCDWERFSTFAREPEQRTVGNDTRISIDGIVYEVEPNLAGEEITLWRGLFDNQLFIEFNEKNYGPYHPVGKLSSLPSYRRFKKTEAEKIADQISAIAKSLDLPRAALEGNLDWAFTETTEEFSQPVPIPFRDPDPFQEFTYPNAIVAKQSIAAYLGQPITKLLPEQRLFINELLTETLAKKIIMERIYWYFQPSQNLPSLELSLEEKENYVN